MAPVDIAPTDPAPTDAVPTEVAPTDVAPVDAAATDIATTEAAVTEAAPTDIAPRNAEPTDIVPPGPSNDLGQVPEGTDVVVLNQAGEAVSLGTMEAADIIANGDPIYCSASVTTPVSGGSGCSTSFGSFKEVIDYLTANPKTAAGVIWISKSYDSSVNDLAGTVGFTLDGSTLGTTANYALTLKGGWNGLGTSTVDTTDPSVFNADALSIIHWNADVTLSDILITGVTGSGSTALRVDTSKKISLTRVKVDTNSGSGAVLDNTRGASDVAITSSEFNGNSGGDGLDATSKGGVTINTITASSNGDWGAWLDNCLYNTGTQRCDVVTAKPVTLTGSNTFNNNGGDGLEAYSSGAITLQ